MIEKPWYKRDPIQILYLTVFPHVNILHHHQAMTSSIFANRNRKDVDLKGTIDKLGYLPGEIITGTVNLENPKKLHIKQIHMYLIQHNRIGCNSRSETICEAILPNIVNTKEQWRTETFSLPIPARELAPTYQFHSASHHAGIASVDYFLQFTVKASGMFTNFDVPIPVIIGTEGQSRAKFYQEYQTQGLYPNSRSFFAEECSDYVHSHPSYYEVTK